jgi:colanic acid/amylovoran biosynthesis protein
MKIFIAEAVPSLNKGEALILKGLIQSLTSFDEIEISLLSYYPEIDKPRYPEVNIISAQDSLNIPPKFPERRNMARFAFSMYICLKHILFGLYYRFFGQDVALKLMPGRIWKAYLESDVIIIGHDSLLQTPFGDAMQFLYIFVSIMAKLIGKFVVVYAGTIGFSPKKGKKFQRCLSSFIQPVWQLIDLITVRDSASEENLMDMNVPKTKVHVTADVAFIAPFVDKEIAWSILNKEGIQQQNGPLIGITLTYNITKCAKPDLYKDAISRYKAGVILTSSLVDNLVEELNATIIFIPHCIEPGSRDDRIVARDVYKLTNRKANLFLIENEYSPEELKGIISCCDIFIGERVHSVIGAISTGVPAISISQKNDQRSYSLLADIIGDCVLNIEDANKDQLANIVKNLYLSKNQKGESERLKPIIERAKYNGILLKELVTLPAV